MAIAQGVFTLLYVPETKDRSLEEIERSWSVAEEVAFQKTIS
jgi:hypothetical protein